MIRSGDVHAVAQEQRPFVQEEALHPCCPCWENSLGPGSQSGMTSGSFCFHSLQSCANWTDLVRAWAKQNKQIGSNCDIFTGPSLNCTEIQCELAHRSFPELLLMSLWDFGMSWLTLTVSLKRWASKNNWLLPTIVWIVQHLCVNPTD